MSDLNALPTLHELEALVDQSMANGLLVYLDHKELHSSDLDEDGLQLIGGEIEQTIIGVRSTLSDGYLLINENEDILRLSFAQAPAMMKLTEVMAYINADEKPTGYVRTELTVNVLSKEEHAAGIVAELTNAMAQALEGDSQGALLVRSKQNLSSTVAARDLSDVAASIEGEDLQTCWEEDIAEAMEAAEAASAH